MHIRNDARYTYLDESLVNVGNFDFPLNWSVISFIEVGSESVRTTFPESSPGSAIDPKPLTKTLSAVMISKEDCRGLGWPMVVDEV